MCEQMARTLVPLIKSNLRSIGICVSERRYLFNFPAFSNFKQRCAEKSKYLKLFFNRKIWIFLWVQLCYGHWIDPNRVSHLILANGPSIQKCSMAQSMFCVYSNSSAIFNRHIFGKSVNFNLAKNWCGKQSIECFCIVHNNRCIFW